jgi:hypothetical protein
MRACVILRNRLFHEIYSHDQPSNMDAHSLSASRNCLLNKQLRSQLVSMSRGRLHPQPEDVPGRGDKKLPHCCLLIKT